MVDKFRWEEPKLLTDGHRLFPLQTDPFKWVAIADDSGHEPQDTEDGVLWLDRRHPLMVNSDIDGEHFSIPLVSDPGGETTRTVTNASTLLYLSSTFKWAIVDITNDTSIYNVEAR